MPLPIDLRATRRILRLLQQQYPDDKFISHDMGKCAQLRENVRIYGQELAAGHEADAEKTRKMMVRNWNELTKHMQRKRYAWPELTTRRRRKGKRKP